MRKELARLMGLRYIADGISDDDISIKLLNGNLRRWRPDIDPSDCASVRGWLFGQYPTARVHLMYDNIASRGYRVGLTIPNASGGAVGITYEEAFCRAVVQVCQKKITTKEELFQVYPNARIEIACAGENFIVDIFINGRVFHSVGTTFDGAYSAALEQL